MTLVSDNCRNQVLALVDPVVSVMGCCNNKLGTEQSGSGDENCFTLTRMPYRANLPGSFSHPHREPGELVPGLVLYGSSVCLADRYCGAGGQPVIGAIWPCEAPALVCLVGRVGNNRLARNAVLVFSRGPR
jgi:hypothetical protein